MNYEEYLDLVETLNKYSYHYYTLDDPIVSDKEYDKKYDLLIQFENSNPAKIVKNSPSFRVGGDVLDKFEKKEHTIPLYSLGKAQSFEEIQKFYSDVQKTLNKKFNFTLEQKLDGLSFVLKYENGFLVEARTRGTGKIGEVVTEQVKTIKSIPLKINFDKNIEVQGEVFMPLDKFNIYNEKISDAFSKELKKYPNPSEEIISKLKNKFIPLKNPRNGAAGALRNLNPKVTAQRPMDAFLYNIPFIEDYEFSSQVEMMEFLKEQGFKVNPYLFEINSYEEMVEKLKEMETIRPQLNFDIDGMVIKLNNTKDRDLLGYTAKHPKWAIAYKFEAIEETTILKEVVWQVGRTGKITPIAILDPVEINGATITKATLNNINDIIRKNVKINSEVFIRRSNDVIPEIMGIVEGSIGEDISAPEVCPECGSKIIEDGAHLFCKNSEECPAQQIGKLVHFAGREAMNIDSFSEKTAEQLWDNNLVRSIKDLYLLKKEDLLSLDRFAEKKADNLIKAIENSKETFLDAFLYGLGIKHVGKGTVERLLRYHNSISEIQKLSVEELSEIEDIGEAVAKSIYDFFHKKKNLDMIEELLSLGISFKQKENKMDENGKLKDLTFVITGTLSQSRKHYETIIKNNGGNVSSSVTKKTSYLLAGEEAGSKKEKALKLGVPILDETNFFNILK